MNCISLDKLRLKASIGILEHELRAKQPLIVSIEVEVADVVGRPARDDVASVFDYRELRNAALAQADAGHVNMIETFAHRIGVALLERPSVLSVRVKVTKPDVFSDCEGASVMLTLRKGEP